MTGFRIKVGKGKIVDGKFKPAPSYRDASDKLRAKAAKNVKVKRGKR